MFANIFKDFRTLQKKGCDTAGARTDPTKIRLHYESGKQIECGEPVGYWPSRTGKLLTDGLRKDLRPTSGY